MNDFWNGLAPYEIQTLGQESLKDTKLSLLPLNTVHKSYTTQLLQYLPSFEWVRWTTQTSLNSLDLEEVIRPYSNVV